MIHEKWRSHLAYLEENVGKKKPEEMAQELDVPLWDLKMFLHRYRMFPETQDRNLIREILTLKFTRAEYFSPTKQFYQDTGIGQRRWWQLYRGDVKMTEKEYKTLTAHFNVTLQDAFQLRQLQLNFE